MFAIMVAPLPPGCRLTGIFDVEFDLFHLMDSLTLFAYMLITYFLLFF
jgi:hypothetical protein